MADPAQARTLRDLVGDPGLGEGDAATVRAVIEATGARDTVECMINDRCEQAVHVLERLPCPPALQTALYRLAMSAAARRS